MGTSIVKDSIVRLQQQFVYYFVYEVVYEDTEIIAHTGMFVNTLFVICVFCVMIGYCSRVAWVKPEMGMFCACREGIPVKKPELTEQRRKIRPFPTRYEL